MSAVEKVNGPFPPMDRLSAPLSWRTSPDPFRPLTVPPTVYVGIGSVMQLTTTLVTFALPTIPEPLLTVQVWPEGWVTTVTA